MVADCWCRYLSELLRMCKCEWVPVQTNAMVCLSNALYYNDDNRQLLEDIPDGVRIYISHSAQLPTWTIHSQPKSAMPEQRILHKYLLSLPQISLVVSLCDASVPDPVSEPAIRALVSLTYPDRLAIPLVVNQEDFIPMLVKQVNSTAVEVRRHASRLSTQFCRLHICIDHVNGAIQCVLRCNDKRSSA